VALRPRVSPGLPFRHSPMCHNYKQSVYGCQAPFVMYITIPPKENAPRVDGGRYPYVKRALAPSSAYPPSGHVPGGPDWHVSTTTVFVTIASAPESSTTVSDTAYSPSSAYACAT